MANRIVVACLLVFSVACSPYSTSQCVTDPDCGIELVCDRGLCIHQPEGSCRSDETRPCGPEAVGLCHPGTQRCSDRHFVEECVGAVTPVAESCNGLDDDCDGVVDNGVTTTYYPDLDGDGFGSAVSTGMTRVGCAPPAGYVASHTDCNDSNAGINPGAAEVCDPMNADENCNGTANEGCGCSNVGMSQACCADRGTQVCEAHPSGPTLSVCTVSPTPELCNGIDDDCDGQTDEEYTLESADGGSVSTDAGVFALDGGCTVGIGACARTAATTCSGGGLTCNVTPGSPSNEQCNGLDDDCDGQTDESGPNLCPASGQTCTAGTCACPAGQSVCGTTCRTLGDNCTAGVGACLRSGVFTCVNGGVSCSAVAGAPVAETCDGIDNDCDGQVDNGVTITCYPDGDNDTFPTSLTPSQQCPAAGRAAFGSCPSGYVSPAISTVVDCDALNPNLFRIVSTRDDVDNDSYCTGVTSSQCVGTNAPAGRRFAAVCASMDDCNDRSAAAFKTYSVRTDADNDGYCVGNVVTQCAGNAPLTGTRLATTCAASDDCRDVNFYATTVCTMVTGFTTDWHYMACGVGLPGTTDTFVPTASFCPNGFTLGNLRTEKRSGAGTCTATASNTLHQTCTGFDASDCRIVGDCTAN